MDHPFIHDADSKTIDELFEIISGLNKKYAMASRLQNQSLMNQLYMAVNTYRTVYEKKQRELYDTSTAENPPSIDIQ